MARLLPRLTNSGAGRRLFMLIALATCTAADVAKPFMVVDHKGTLLINATNGVVINGVDVLAHITGDLASAKHCNLPDSVAVTDVTGPCNATVLGVARCNTQTQNPETCRRAETWDGDFYFWHPRGLPQYCILGDVQTSSCTQCIPGYTTSQAPKAPCQIQADLLHLSFDNNLLDLSYNRRNILYYGAAPDNLFGRDGTDGSPALVLSGADQHLRAPANVIGGAFSVCVDVMFDTFGLSSRIFDFSMSEEGTRLGANNNLLMLNRHDSNDILFEAYQGNHIATQLRSNNFFEAGIWAHVCVTATSDGTYTLYKNGVQTMQMSNAPPIPYLRRTSNYIGRSNFNDNPDFDGAIDNLRMWSRALTSSQIADLFLESQGVQRPAAMTAGDALLLHYTFENTLQDASGLDNNGVAFNHHNMNLYQVNAPEGDMALYLDGVNDYVIAPSLSLKNAFTVCSWVRYRSLQFWSRVADFNNGGVESIFIGNSHETTTLEFTFLFEDRSLDTFMIVAGGFDWAYGGFQHYCFTLEGPLAIVYRQGREIGRNSNMRVRNSTEYRNIFIGRSTFAGDDYFGGNLDDYRVYNFALSAEDVHHLLCQGRPDLDCVGLVAHFKFDGNVRDASGNEWHGELVPVNIRAKDLFFENTNVAVGTGALLLPGNGSWVQLPARNFGGDFTVCSWIQTRRVGMWERIVDFGNSTNRMYIARWNTNAELFMEINGEVVRANLPADKADVFIHVCGFSNSTGGYLAIDGELVGSNVGMLQMPVGWLDVNYIGKSAAAVSDAPLDAVLDDLRIYDHALSMNEVAQLANMAL